LEQVPAEFQRKWGLRIGEDVFVDYQIDLSPPVRQELTIHYEGVWENLGQGEYDGCGPKDQSHSRSLEGLQWHLKIQLYWSHHQRPHGIAVKCSLLTSLRWGERRLSAQDWNQERDHDVHKVASEGFFFLVEVSDVKHILVHPKHGSL
jgi:hypothetical protein